MSQSFSIFLLRHGEISHSKSLAGHTDFELTDIGWRQMLQATQKLSVAQCISSPLSRCSQFAGHLCQSQSLPLQLEDAIKEMDFGDWDGLLYEALWQQPKPNIGDFWQSPTKVTPPGGERFEDFVNRIEKWFVNLVANSNSEDVLVITHAGVIKVLLGLVLTNSLFADKRNLTQIEKSVAITSVGYGKIVTLKVFVEQGFEPHIQLAL